MRFIATFTIPEWQTVGLSPTGVPEQKLEWDCTNAFADLPGDYQDKLIREMNERGEALDRRDALRTGAPQEVQTAPFFLHVRRAKPTYEELAQVIEELLAATDNQGEQQAPDEWEWNYAFNAWQATEVHETYYSEPPRPWKNR
jgi:hypothetical protein